MDDKELSLVRMWCENNSMIASLAAKRLVDEIDRQAAEIAELIASAGECVWTHEPDSDVWEMQCGEAVVFEDTTPAENGYKFCHSCGRKIVFVETYELDGDK